MQKVLDLLEKHVQWLVLGLGGAFLLLMVYSYVVTPPATVPIGSTERTAADVDSTIMEATAEPLARAADNSEPMTIAVEPFDEKFLAAIANKDVRPADMGGLIQPVLASDTGGVKRKPEDRDPNAPVQGVSGNINLAVLPKAVPVPDGVVPGRSMVQIPPPPVDPNAPAADATGAGGAGGMMNFGGGPGAVQPAMNLADRDWTTAFFKIRMPDLTAAWRAAGVVPPKVPQVAQQTLFLQVIAEREEQTGVDESGAPVWGNHVTLKPLPTVSLVELPDPAIPPAGQVAYEQWAAQHQPDILQPPFYVVGGGDPWHEPGVVVAPVADVNAPMIDPGMMPGGPGADPAKMTPAERQAERKRKAAEIKAARDAAAAEKAASRRQPGASGPGGLPGMTNPRPTGPGQNRYQVADPNRPNRTGRPPGPGGAGYNPFQPRPGTGTPPYPMTGGMRPGSGNIFGGDPNNLGAARGLPQGAFVPSPQGPDVDVWVHDDSVKPGKTYRYRIRYAMKNPVFNTNLAGPAVVNVFALTQDENSASDWTTPVTIATRTQFFIVGLPPNKVTIRVYRWQEGRLNAKDFTVYPGDQIGTVDPDQAIDYSTGHTVVDIRDNGTVLVMDDQNAVRVRTFEGDQKSPERSKLQEEAARVNPPTALGELPPGALVPR